MLGPGLFGDSCRLTALSHTPSAIMFARRSPVFNGWTGLQTWAAPSPLPKATAHTFSPQDTGSAQSLAYRPLGLAVSYSFILLNLE